MVKAFRDHLSQFDPLRLAFGLFGEFGHYDHDIVDFLREL
jgi:hypothetical protein